MAETTRPSDNQEVQRNHVSNLDRIFQEFWLKLEHRLQQSTIQKATHPDSRHLTPSDNEQLQQGTKPKDGGRELNTHLLHASCNTETTGKTEHKTSSSTHCNRGYYTPAARSSQSTTTTHDGSPQ
ncbi:Hypothetical predicted protein, partial [Pelobates cultripes]